MSTGTVMLNLVGDARRLQHRVAGVAGQLRLLGVCMASAGQRLGERERARRELAVGRELQAGGQGWDVQVITTNKGHCRVVVRQLGGW